MVACYQGTYVVGKIPRYYIEKKGTKEGKRRKRRKRRIFAPHFPHL